MHYESFQAGYRILPCHSDAGCSSHHPPPGGVPMAMTPDRIARIEAKARRDGALLEHSGPDKDLLERLHQVDQNNEAILVRLDAFQIGALVLCAEGLEPYEETISEEENFNRQAAFLNGFQMGHDYCARYGPLKEEHDDAIA